MSNLPVLTRIFATNDISKIRRGFNLPVDLPDSEVMSHAQRILSELHNDHAKSEGGLGVSRLWKSFTKNVFRRGDELNIEHDHSLDEIINHFSEAKRR
jgi:hypothetical protein